MSNPKQSARRGTANSRSRGYYIALFTVDSWREFLAAGGAVVGFNAAKLPILKTLKRGDRLLCYLTKVSAFVGVLEVAGDAYEDSSTIWTDGIFPARLPVRVRNALPLEHAIPMRYFSGKLSFLRQGMATAAWTIHVRTSPRRWGVEDATRVERMIRQRDDGEQSVAAEIKDTPPRPAEIKSNFPTNMKSDIRVGRVVARTRNILQQDAGAVLGSYDSVLSFNKVTGYSVNVPIAVTCSPTAVCAKTCYFASGAPSWSNAIRHQLRVYHTIRHSPARFAERVALEYDRLNLSFLRWNGGGDLFQESVEAINHLGRIRPDIVLWVVTRQAEHAAAIEDHPNIYIHYSIDRHSRRLMRDVKVHPPRNRKFFFSYQCDPEERPDASVLTELGISVLFFDAYVPTCDLQQFDQEIICPLNTAADLANVCEGCRRCFDGSAVQHRIG